MKKVTLKSARRTLAAMALLTALTVIPSLPARADEDGFSANIQADLVSAYVWRGMYQTGASFQPTLGIDWKGLSLTAWGSTDFDGVSASAGRAAKEVDLTLGYEASCGLAVSVTDYWWDGQGAARYFDYAAHTTAHHFEATLAYTLPVKKFPLSLAWSTMFAGDDYNFDGKHAYSSYLQLSYPFAIKAVDMQITLGASPYKSQSLYGCNGFAVTDVSARGTYTLTLGQHLEMPLFTQLTFNPRAQDAHIVFGLSLVPKF